MKKLALVVLALCFAASFVYAQEGAMADTVTLNGIIVDNMCAGAHSADIAEFVKTHPKSCALMPECEASGYSIFTDGALMSFDKDSSAKIAEFLKKEDSSLEVTVVAKKGDKELSLVSIANASKEAAPVAAPSLDSAQETGK